MTQFKGEPGQLPPGLHIVMIDSFTALEERLTAHMLSTGDVTLKMDILKPRQIGKTVTFRMVDDFYFYDRKGKRSLRNRHHQRKTQPNCGPRKPNQW